MFNQVSFRPLPWVNATFDSQLPIFNGKRGFTEVDSAVQIMPTSNLDVTISHRYLDNNPFFVNSSLLRFNVYYRLDDNWGAGFTERYEFAAHQILQAQSYTIYRDLSSFVASLGFTVRDNNGVNDYGFLLNFTLKGDSAGVAAGRLRRELGGERSDAVASYRTKPHTEATEVTERRARIQMKSFPFLLLFLRDLRGLCMRLVFHLLRRGCI